MKKSSKIYRINSKRVENKIGERFHIISKALYGDKKMLLHHSQVGISKITK
jgi:hypothetical protein